MRGSIPTSPRHLPGGEPGARSGLGLALLFALAVGLARLPVALAHLDTRYPYELFSGNVAQALLDGLDLDVAHLYIISHIRGGALFGALAAPLFALLGPTALALKLVPLLWHAATVGLLVAVCRRAFGAGAAWTTGALLLCAPPLLAKLSVLGLASHMESTLPIVLLWASFLVLTVERRHTRVRFALFGAALGFSAFFHLQALLAALLMLALTVLQEPRALLRGLAPLIVGAALGVSPGLLFDEGDWKIATAVGDTPSDRILHVEDTGLAGPVRINGTAAKAQALVTDGLGPLLEFGQLGAPVGRPVAHLYGIALLLGAVLAIWRERRELVGLFRRLAGRAAPVSPLAFFALHALAVPTLLVLSGLTLNHWFVGSGLDGRRLAPMLISLLVLAGVGLAPRAGERRAPRWILLGVLCAAGAAGSVAAARATAADRLMTHGTCYPWFLKQLQAHAGSPSRLVETIVQLDRGDRRFLTLRYAPPMPFSADEPVVDALARATADAAGTDPTAPGPPAVSAPEAVLWRTTGLGRALGRSRERLIALGEAQDAIARLPPLARAALLHGVGASLTAQLPRTAELPSELVVLAQGFAPANAELVFEGHGFALGFVHDPYNGFLRRRLVTLAGLPEPARAAAYRGFGWGFRQRYVTPPTELPDGLSTLALVPQASHHDFLDGLLGRVLPAEAAVLAQ